MPARRQADDPKQVIYCRVRRSTVDALDAMCEAMRPPPSRAELIDEALAEFVRREGARKGKGGRRGLG